jgi:rubrerythrin
MSEKKQLVGKWVWDVIFSDYACSICGEFNLKTPKYCPNCGARMKGE